MRSQKVQAILLILAIAFIFLFTLFGGGDKKRTASDSQDSAVQVEAPETEEPHIRSARGIGK